MSAMCKVNYCRYADTHTTGGHQCGICGEYGHGQTECGNDEHKIYLEQFMSEQLLQKDWCNLCPPDSDSRKRHKREAHVCSNCNERTQSHNEDQCIIGEFEVFRQRFPDMLDIIQFNIDTFKQHGCPIYTTLYAGMGCEIYVRHKDGEVKALFMHSDSWGQYGPIGNDKPKLDAFIDTCVVCDKEQFIN